MRGTIPSVCALFFISGGTNMRNLETQDVFAFVRLIDEVGIKDELKTLIMSKDKMTDLTQESFGYDLIFTLISGASKKKAEEALYEFFSGIMEVDKEVIRHMEPTEFIESAIKIADVEKWKNFFGSVAKLMK
jgi:hypothetical protein